MNAGLIMNAVLKGQLGIVQPMSWKTEVIASNMVLGSDSHLSRPVFSSVKLVD